MTVNFRAKRCPVNDILKLIFYPDSLFSPEKPDRLIAVMDENAVLHLKYGLDNSLLVAYRYRGWTIEGIPDQILDDMVIEGKVVRKGSNIEKLKAVAWFQACIYALALELPKFKVVLFKPTLEEFWEKEFETKEEEPKVKSYLDVAIEILNSLSSLAKAGEKLAKGAWQSAKLASEAKVR